MTAKRVSKDVAVVYMNDHPHAEKNGGAGFYEIFPDNENDHSTPKTKFGKKLEWVKDKADNEGEPANPENNEGHWVYAGSDQDEE